MRTKLLFALMSLILFASCGKNNELAPTLEPEPNTIIVQPEAEPTPDPEPEPEPEPEPTPDPDPEPEPVPTADPDLPNGPQSKNGNLDSTHPFIRLANFNIMQDGKTFMTKHDNWSGNGHFTFEETEELSLPDGYVLPTREELETFVPAYFKNAIEYAEGAPAYKTIGKVHFRYNYKKFNEQKGYYLEILAIEGGSSDDAKSHLDANTPKVAARYFPCAGSKKDGLIERQGGRGRYWSSSASELFSEYAWCLGFAKIKVYVDENTQEAAFCVRPLTK